MESQPQNPEFRNNPENFHPCDHGIFFLSHSSPSADSRTVLTVTSKVCALSTG